MVKRGFVRHARKGRGAGHLVIALWESHRTYFFNLPRKTDTVLTTSLYRTLETRRCCYNFQLSTVVGIWRGNMLGKRPGCHLLNLLWPLEIKCGDFFILNIFSVIIRIMVFSLFNYNRNPFKDSGLCLKMTLMLTLSILLIGGIMPGWRPS